MRWRQSVSLVAAVLFAATLMVGWQARAAEARGAHGGFRAGFRTGGFGHSGFRQAGSSHRFFHHGHRFLGSRGFVGVGLGFAAFPYAYAYTAYYPAYPAYPSVYSPGYYGACYAYDAYGRCVSYSPASSYPYPY